LTCGDRDKTSSHPLLRHVYTGDGTPVGQALIAGGWAQPVEYAPDLDCRDIAFRRFKVIGVAPHRFDGDHDGIG
jgi:hypothetical protein